ncbi:serine hydrolase domain-containing protein [Psychrobacter sp. AOP7-B1-25]|uniref:serine hydrolase domain-containing protein n=1 Tax=Psychrobacter sp. AOP7-B1-25 TaxID=3457644 RepID=UPI00402B423D
MNRKIIIKNSLIIIVSLAVILEMTYLYTAKHKWLDQASYHLQLPYIKSSIYCSDAAPDFMYELMDNLIIEQKSMSNQIVYQSKNGKLSHCESGWKDGFRGEHSIDVDSRFRYASVSKVVTSAIVLNLINQDKLNLDQKLMSIINVPEPKDKRIHDITIGMLLEHSAGFDRLKTYTPMLTMGVKPWCPTNIERLAEVELDFDPNTQFQYSNVGYCLLGAVVEVITGTTFREAAEDIYQLNNKDIKFVDDSFLVDEVTYDYRYENFYGASYYKYFDFRESLSAVGGLSGSAKSMVLLTRDMLNEQPINILSRAQTPCAIDKIGGCYGYALEPYQKSGHNFIIYNKSGFFPGVNTDIFVDGQGGILALYRGASTPSYNVKKQLHQQIYISLENYYENDGK